MKETGAEGENFYNAAHDCSVIFKSRWVEFIITARDIGYSPNSNLQCDST